MGLILRGETAVQYSGGSTLLQCERVPQNSLPQDLTKIAKVDFSDGDVADSSVLMPDS